MFRFCLRSGAQRVFRSRRPLRSGAQVVFCPRSSLSAVGYSRFNEDDTLHLYDLPRDMKKRYDWVIRWRTAREQCRHPRQSVVAWISHYDKRTGLRTDFNSCLGKLAAAKAQITKAGRCIERHIAEQNALYPLFYDEAADTELVRYREKLARKIESCRQIEENIRLAVENYRREGRGE